MKRSGFSRRRDSIEHTISRLLCRWFGHRWTRWAGYRQLLSPRPGQMIEIPAEALVASIAGVYVIQGRIYCRRCKHVVRGSV